MSSYFPIPPNIPLRNNSVFSSITLGGFSNNNLRESMKNSIQKEINYVLYKLENKYWKRIKEVKCNYGDFIEIQRSNLDVDNDELVVALCCKEGTYPIKTNCLPKPISLRIDSAPIAERASYNFKLNGSISSYQGEYPEKMIKLNKGTFLTSDSLKNPKINLNSNSFLLLLNINQDSNINNEHTIFAMNPYTKELIKKIHVKSNAFNLINLDELYNGREKFKIKNLFFYCKTSVFVPIFINTFLDDDRSEINVEHTHPPAQYFWPTSVSKGVKLLKSNWFRYL